jgi:hypothetical protein
MLAEAQTFKRTMLDEKHRLEQEAFQIPAPPLRAAPPMAAPATAAPVDAFGGAGGNVLAPAGASAGAGAAAAPPIEPVRREMSSEEITGALGNLADLRDRGAISAEEYEAKKRDLLARL